MAEPVSASKALIKLERSLKELLVKICESEQRSKLLSTLLRLELLPRDVKNFSMKQLLQQRGLGRRGLGKKLFKTGKKRLLGKLMDSRRDETKLRKERDKLRNELEGMVTKGVFLKIWRRLRTKILRIRVDIKNKNSDKIKGYIEERNMEDLEELSILQKEMGEFANLRIFSGEPIEPEERKPPVTSKEVNLSKYELEVLSKHPKYAVRATMSKEKWMLEFEKGMCKKLYGDIGKEIVDGKTVDEDPTDPEDKRIMKEAEWQERKSELVYDFEEKDLNFGRQKATEMKHNKRVTLPKSSDAQVEALIEVRRKRALQLYDMCRKKLGEGAEKGKDNLTMGERRGLKSLKKRVDEGEVVICQTDKSGRFCVLTREQYLEAGMVHVKNDRKISNEEQGEVERAVNGHMRWWGSIWGLGSNWKQESRCLSNLINHGLGTCPMTLLIKDHKTWSMVPKTRSVMGGNEGGNCGISEFLSLVLEPVAGEQGNSMEISATNGLLADIADLNAELEEERRTGKISTPEEEISIPQEEDSSLQEESSSHEEAMPNQAENHVVADLSDGGDARPPPG